MVPISYMLSGKHMEEDMPNEWEEARKIANRHQPYVGAGGSLISHVSIAVAEGITFGRKEGLELAAKVINAEIAKLQSTLPHA